LTLIHEKLTLLNIALLQDFLPLDSDEVRQLGLFHLLVLDFAQDLIFDLRVLRAYHDRCVVVVVVHVVDFCLVLLALVSDSIFQSESLSVIQTGL